MNLIKKIIIYSILFIFMASFYFLFVEEAQKIKKEEKKKPTIKKSVTVKKNQRKNKKIILTIKKKKFLNSVLPSIVRVHAQLEQRYEKIAKDIKNGTNKSEIDKLKARYKVTSDEDLLAKLKPHPVSIVLAQAALESSWGKSRFAKEANNYFGMWSSDENEPRIAAGEQRDNNRTIWLKKFNSLDDSVRDYYDTIARVKVYKKFRNLRLRYNNPYKITPGLDKYSEMGQSYVDNINQVIRYNDFTQYDKKLPTHYSKLH